ncbi:hypothetical protein SAMN05216480_11275 [Pustulibacterium marinum]|uniref:Lipocalin-like domain-containing protein n=1 Tax=Pustulibacterium marinum TaxID=1224947 RepID=A0A1I7I1S5_9FLAO|nr:hypothetical protein [Pustulibacterium marinum]SFU66912.1 hypothetical protein SAMN05216480_11275 [Pustulibacterium marinum]
MRTILLLISMFISLLSCSTNDDDTFTNADILGDWIWLQTTGGIGGGMDTPETTGQTITLTISETTIKEYIDGELVIDANYTIELDDYYGEQVQVIIMEDIAIGQRIRYLDENTLELSSHNMFDGFQHVYARE